MLRTEYEIYRHLQPKRILGGLTTTLCLFDDTEDDLCALVMLYMGEPERNVSASDHRENILVSDSGVTIVNFTHSQQCDDQGAMDEEYTLRSFLSFK